MSNKKELVYILKDGAVKKMVVEHLFNVKTKSFGVKEKKVKMYLLVSADAKHSSYGCWEVVHYKKVHNTKTSLINSL